MSRLLRRVALALIEVITIAAAFLVIVALVVLLLALATRGFVL